MHTGEGEGRKGKKKDNHQPATSNDRHSANRKFREKKKKRENQREPKNGARAHQ